MKGFIEVHVNRVERLLNIRHIEMVIKNMGGSCIIYFAVATPGAVDLDYIRPEESYDLVKRMIEEATK